MFKRQRGHILILVWQQSKRCSESNVCMQRWCLPPIKWDLNVGPTNCQSRYKRQSRTPEISQLNSTWEGGRQRMRNAFSNLIFAASGREMFWPPSKIKHRGHRVLVFVRRQLVASFCQKKSSTGQILPTLETWKTLLMIDQNCVANWS